VPEEEHIQEPSPVPEPKPSPVPEEIKVPESESKTSAELVMSSTESVSAPDAPASSVSEPAAAKNVVVEHEFASKSTARTTTIMSEGINFLRTVASEILDKIVVGDTPIIVVAMELIQWAEKNMRQFSGQEKKRIVLKLLNWLIDNQEDVLNNALGDNAHDLHLLVDTVVPSILDAVCSAAKGKYDINIPKKAAKGCLTFLCGL
jgi:Tfp pilus assembly protein FimV